MNRWLIALRLVLASVLSIPASPAAAGDAKGHALVVGVTTYPGLYLGPRRPDNDPNLPNPENDAIRIAEALTVMGFDVTTLLSSKGTAQRTVIEEAWRTVLSNTRSSQTALFYFAGHGVELFGRNFLVPQDAIYNVSDQGKLKSLTRTAIDFQRVIIGALSGRQEAQPGITGLFIIDACRENIFTENEKIDESVPMGLRAILPPKDMFVMYSAGIEQSALDGPEDGNSVYAEKLLNILGNTEARNESLANIAQSLRLEVYYSARDKAHLQTPAYYDQLTASRSILGEDRPIRPTENKRADVKTRDLGGRDVIIDCTYCPEVVPIAGGPGPAFGIGKFEVTNREWDTFARAQKRGDLRTNPSESRLERLPVTDVTHEDAEAYVHWLTEFTGHSYRLPTEGEWEFAARGNTTTPYSFAATGHELNQLCIYANGADQMAGAIAYANQACNDGVGREVAPVGTYKPNPFGLFDVHGNVWEWVADCWSPDPKFSDAKGACPTYVARGGSWRSGANALRSDSRTGFPKDHGRATLGFRIVRELEK